MMPAGFGRHMPLEAHPTRALDTARAIGCDAVQIFVSSPRTWSPPATTPRQTAVLAEALRAFTPVAIHAAYLINCPSSTPATREKSQALLEWTLQRGAELGAADVVMHIGSHGGDGAETGLERLVAALARLGETIPDDRPRLLLENDVGAGNTLGADFAWLGRVLAALQPVWGDRLGCCLDTAHLWGAGEDIGTPEAASATLDRIDAAIDLARVHVIHLNDTSVRLGGHRDLHARLGEGIIGTGGLQAFLRDPRLRHAAIILETPLAERPDGGYDWEDEARRIASARVLAGRG